MSVTKHFFMKKTNMICCVTHDWKIKLNSISSFPPSLFSAPLLFARTSVISYVLSTCRFLS